MARLRNIPKPNGVAVGEEQRAIQAIIDGQNPSTTGINDMALYRAVTAVKQGSPIPNLNGIKDQEARRIFKKIKIRLEA